MIPGVLFWSGETLLLLCMAMMVAEMAFGIFPSVWIFPFFIGITLALVGIKLKDRQIKKLYSDNAEAKQ